MARLFIAAFVIAAQAAAAAGAAAQGLPDASAGEPTGVRESARTLDIQRVTDAIGAARMRTEQPATREPDVFLVLPSLVGADGLTVGGASAAYVSKRIPAHPIQLRGGYRRSDVDGPGDLDQVSFDGKMPIINGESTRLTPYAEIKRVLNTSRRARVGASLEQTFAQKLTIGANLEYANAKRDGAQPVEDLIPGLGMNYAWSDFTETSVDYSFKNDVDGEYDVSFTLSQRLTPASQRPLSLVFGVARHRTVFITVVKPFSLRAGAR